MEGKKKARKIESERKNKLKKRNKAKNSATTYFLLLPPVWDSNSNNLENFITWNIEMKMKTFTKSSARLVKIYKLEATRERNTKNTDSLIHTYV